MKSLLFIPHCKILVTNTLDRELSHRLDVGSPLIQYGRRLPHNCGFEPWRFLWIIFLLLTFCSSLDDSDDLFVLYSCIFYLFSMSYNPLPHVFHAFMTSCVLFFCIFFFKWYFNPFHVRYVFHSPAAFTCHIPQGPVFYVVIRPRCCLFVIPLPSDLP